MPNLSRLLRPASIAVIGGGTWCANVIRECRRIGFAGDIWPVHPHRKELAGLEVFGSVNDLPTGPDAAFIGVNSRASVQIVAALAARDVGGAVCFAAGFSEASGEIDGASALQDTLVRAAGDMPILGPNCYGFLNLLDGAALWPDQHGATRVDKGVAIVTQSSNIAINLTMQQRGLPLAYVVTAGNQAQTGISQIGAALLSDPRVTALGLHIEGIDDLAEFQQLAMLAQTLKKPIVAMKVGRSAKAQSATLSHTASLAGSSTGADALMERLGIAHVTSLSVMLETLKLLHLAGPLPSRRIASMSCSGGEASLVADAAQDFGLDCPDLTSAQCSGLRAVLGDQIALANPLDYNTFIWKDREAMSRTFAIMLAADVALGAIVLDFPHPERCADEEWDIVIGAAADASHRTGKPLALLSTLPETLSETKAAAIIAEGLIPLAGLEVGLGAIAAASRFDMARQPAGPVLGATIPRNPKPLSEAEAKALLGSYGLRVPRSQRTGSVQQAADLATEIGFPVVLKGEGIAHKTEAGAVRLNLQDQAEVLTAAQAMPCTSFLVEEMIDRGIAELLIGVTCDPAHGYLLTLAAGGTLTELLQDRKSLLLPVSREQIDAALSALRIADMLDGWRGGPKADRNAILDAVLAVQAFVMQHQGEISELDINPLICGPDFAIAADILLIKGEKDD
ncbi:acetate--CoA ligase family protein [Paracoccus sp. Z330]|uniref:Acetate--CoA ligase family protein n=1 Tax=Paracoccus onchidii TaxID=3017813 RepID=A0ABT4ZG46_9RHOB|nr:acetate--CoA ligase family protein [Paracoccus onchidii]MDB6178295.1 acetate--CoA ligase family protein [Paracoccus onchidii]